MLAAELHHPLIYVHHQHPLNPPVTQDLAQHRPLAAADNHDPPRPGVKRHHRVDQGLVIDMLVKSR